MSRAETALQPDSPAEPSGHLMESGPSIPESGGILTINLAAIVAIVICVKKYERQMCLTHLHETHTNQH